LLGWVQDHCLWLPDLEEYGGFFAKTDSKHVLKCIVHNKYRVQYTLLTGIAHRWSIWLYLSFKSNIVLLYLPGQPLVRVNWYSSSFIRMASWPLLSTNFSYLIQCVALALFIITLLPYSVASSYYSFLLHLYSLYAGFSGMSYSLVYVLLAIVFFLLVKFAWR